MRIAFLLCQLVRKVPNKTVPILHLFPLFLVVPKVVPLVLTCVDVVLPAENLFLCSQVDAEMDQGEHGNVHEDALDEQRRFVTATEPERKVNK